MPIAVICKGVLVECDPSIKAIILNIDAQYNEFVVEDLDETTLLIKDNKINELKRLLDEKLSEHTKVDTLEEEDEEGDD